MTLFAGVRSIPGEGTVDVKQTIGIGTYLRGTSQTISLLGKKMSMQFAIFCRKYHFYLLFWRFSDNWEVRPPGREPQSPQLTVHRATFCIIQHCKFCMFLPAGPQTQYKPNIISLFFKVSTLSSLFPNTKRTKRTAWWKVSKFSDN